MYVATKPYCSICQCLVLEKKRLAEALAKVSCYEIWQIHEPLDKAEVYWYEDD